MSFSSSKVLCPSISLLLKMEHFLCVGLVIEGALLVWSKSLFFNKSHWGYHISENSQFYVTDTGTLLLHFVGLYFEWVWAVIWYILKLEMFVVVASWNLNDRFFLNVGFTPSEVSSYTNPERCLPPFVHSNLSKRSSSSQFQTLISKLWRVSQSLSFL